MAARPPPPGVHPTASNGGLARAPSAADEGNRTVKAPPAAALASGPPPISTTNIAFLCHYTVVDATINDKVVTTIKENEKAMPKTMTRTSQNRLSSNILSLFSVPSTQGPPAAAAGKTYSTLFPSQTVEFAADGGPLSADNNSTPPSPTRRDGSSRRTLSSSAGSAHALQSATIPLPAKNNGGFLPSCPHPIVQEIITAFNGGVRAKTPQVAPSNMPQPIGSFVTADRGDMEDPPQDRTGLNIASDAAYNSNRGFVGLVLRDTSSKTAVNAVFNLGRLLDIQLIVGGDGTPNSTMPAGGDFKGGSVSENVKDNSSYSAETSLGLLQSLLDGSKEQRKPIKLQLLFAHHSEPMRNVTVGGLPAPNSNVKSLTALVLNLAPFPAGSNGSLLMLTEESEGVRNMCRIPSAFVDMKLYANLMASVALFPPNAATILALAAKRLLLVGQQTQLPTMDKRNEKRMLEALQKALASVSSGSASTFPLVDDALDSSISGGVTRAESMKSTVSSLAPAAAHQQQQQQHGIALPSAMRGQGPSAILTPVIVDSLLQITTDTIRKRDSRGPCPDISATDGKESSTTTAANHVAEAAKKFLLFGTVTPSYAGDSASSQQTGSTLVLIAFIQHLLIVLDGHNNSSSSSAIKLPPTAPAMSMNPFVAALFEPMVRPIMQTIGGISIELIAAENERRAAEVQRLADIAAAGVAAQEAEARRNDFLASEEEARSDNEAEEETQFDHIIAAAENDRRRIVALFLERQRIQALEREREQERLRAINERFRMVFDRLQQDEAKYRQDYARAEVADLRNMFGEYVHERLLVDQFLARDAMRKAERPERIHLWAEEKRCRTEVCHAIRQMQMQIYRDMRAAQHEAQHKAAYLEHVRLMGEISTLNDRYHQMMYIRARLEAEVLEKESKFLNRPHADALGQVVGAIVQRHGPAADGSYNGPNSRFYDAAASSNRPMMMMRGAVGEYSPIHGGAHNNSEYSGGGSLQIPLLQTSESPDRGDPLLGEPSPYRRAVDKDFDLL